MTEIYDLPALPPRPDDAHKGTFGTLLILGGSPQMIGATMLAARAAYRAGCGLVQVAMPRAVLAEALTMQPEAIGLGLQGNAKDADRLRRAMDRATAVVAGPGLGSDPQGDAQLATIYRGETPAVFDADALNRLAAMPAWPDDFRAPAVLTPHAGEMRRLARHLGRDNVPTDEAGRIELAGHAARLFRCIALLKGLRTVVTDGERYRVNATGDNTLAKAGSGDVLSGLIGALLALGMSPFDAAMCGAHYHGLAGQAAGSAIGRRGALASEVADKLPAVMG